MVWWPKRKTNACSSNVSLVSKDVKTCVDWDFNFYNAGYSSYSLLTPSLFSLTSHVVFKKTLLQSISHLRPSSISFSAEAVAFSDEAIVRASICLPLSLPNGIRSYVSLQSCCTWWSVGHGLISFHMICSDG